MTVAPHQLKPRALFFDLDGTLIDSAPDLAWAAQTMRRHRNLPPLPFDLYRPMAGAGARGMLQVAFGISPENADFEAMKEEFFANYAASIKALSCGDPSARTCAFEGVPDMLHDLQTRGLAWGIVTNKSKRFTEPLVRAIPMLQNACAVVSGDSTPRAKPYPEPLLEAIRLTSRALQGLQPNQCWYIGDDKRDIDAGHAAGMCAIAASWGYEGEHELTTWGADFVLHQPVDLFPRLSDASRCG